MERPKNQARSTKLRKRKSVACQTDDLPTDVANFGNTRVRSVAGGGVVVQHQQTTGANQADAQQAQQQAVSGGGADPVQTTSKTEEGVLRLTIPGFSKLADTKCSDAIRIQTVPWRIMVMPKQHMMQKKSQKCLGFFLQCCPDNAYSDSWSCHAVAEMRLLSQRPGGAHFARKTNHTYTSKENDWGYSCFMTWADILDEAQGYIKDDTISLEISLKAEEPKNMMTRDEFRRTIDKWYELASKHLARGAIDLAIEANAQALKYCKDKDKESKDRLEEQKKTIIQQKLIESIERIEKGKDPGGTSETAAVTSTSLKQVLTGAQKTLAGAKATDKRGAATTKAKQTARGAVVKSPQHAVLKKKMELQKQAALQHKSNAQDKNKKPSVRGDGFDDSALQNEEAAEEEDDEKGQGDNRALNGEDGEVVLEDEEDEEEGEDDETQSYSETESPQYGDDDDLTDETGSTTVAPLTLGDDPHGEEGETSEEEEDEECEEDDEDEECGDDDPSTDPTRHVEVCESSCQTDLAFNSQLVQDPTQQQQATALMPPANRPIAVPKRSTNKNSSSVLLDKYVQRFPITPGSGGNEQLEQFQLAVGRQTEKLLLPYPTACGYGVVAATGVEGDQPRQFELIVGHGPGGEEVNPQKTFELNALMLTLHSQNMLQRIEEMLSTAQRVLSVDVVMMMARVTALSQSAAAFKPETKKKTANVARQIVNSSVVTAVAQSPNEPPPVPVQQQAATLPVALQLDPRDYALGQLYEATGAQLPFSELIRENLQQALQLHSPEKDESSGEQRSETAAAEDAAFANLVHQTYIHLERLEQYVQRVEQYNELLRNLEKNVNLPEVKKLNELARKNEQRVVELEAAHKSVMTALAKERQSREHCEAARATAQLKAEDEEQKKEAANNLLKEKRAEIRRLEKRGKQDETRITELTAQVADLEEKLKTARKELDATKKRTAEERAKWKKEKERDTELMRRLESDLNEREQEKERVQHALDEKAKESRQKSDTIAKERKAHAATVTAAVERARKAECAQLDAELAAGLQVLEFASNDATTYITEVDEGMKRARSTTDLELLRKSSAEWKQLKEEIRTLGETLKATVAQHQEQIRSGAKSLAQLPRVSAPRPPKPPARVAIPQLHHHPIGTPGPIGSSPLTAASTSSPIVAPVAPMPAVPPLTPSTPQHGVIGQPRPSQAQQAQFLSSTNTSPGSVFAGGRVSPQTLSAQSNMAPPPESPIRQQPAPIGSSRPQSGGGGPGVIGQPPPSSTAGSSTTNEPATRKTVDDFLDMTPSFSPWGWQNPMSALGEGLQPSALNIGNSSSQSSGSSMFHPAQHHHQQHPSSNTVARPASVASARYGGQQQQKYAASGAFTSPYDHGLSAEMAQLNGAATAAAAAAASVGWNAGHGGGGPHAAFGQGPNPPQQQHHSQQQSGDVFTQGLWNAPSWSLAPGQRPTSYGGNAAGQQMGGGSQGGQPQQQSGRSSQPPPPPGGAANYKYMSSAMFNS